MSNKIFFILITLLLPTIIYSSEYDTCTRIELHDTDALIDKVKGNITSKQIDWFDATVFITDEFDKGEVVRTYVAHSSRRIKSVDRVYEDGFTIITIHQVKGMFSDPNLVTMK